MRDIYKIIFFLLIGLLFGCDNSDETRISISWEAYWVNSQNPYEYGTFSLDGTIEGTYLDEMNGTGVITGTINWYDDTGALVLSSSVTGDIANDIDSNNTYCEFEITTTQNEIVLSGSYGSYAASLDSDDFFIASFEYEDVNGTWHTCPGEAGIESCDIASIITLDTEVLIQDLCWTAGTLYGVIVDDSDYSIISIDSLTGTVQSLTVDCPYPRGITYDGTYFWVLNIEEGEIVEYTSTLYKYNSSWVLQGTIPVPNHGMYGTVPTEITWWNDSIASFIEGSFFIDGIKLISPTTGANTVLIPQSIPRAIGLAAASTGFWTGYSGAGGTWCYLNLYNTSGNVIKSIYSPLNSAGPLASDGVDIWISIGQYIYRISGD